MSFDINQMLPGQPLMVPNWNYRKWSGILDLEDWELNVSMDCPNFPSSCETVVTTTSEYYGSILRNNESKIKELTEASSSFQDFIEKFVNLIKSIKFLRDDRKPAQSLQKINRVYSEIKEIIGESNVEYISPELDFLTLITYTESHEKRAIKLKVPRNYPRQRLSLCECDLPNACLAEGAIKLNSITEAYKSFEGLTSCLQPFWDLCDELYANYIVLDPPMKNPRISQLRLSIGDNVSLLLIINPMDPFSVPQMNLIGADKAITPYREKMGRLLKEIGWDAQRDFVRNLLLVLDLEELPRSEIQYGDSNERNTQSEQMIGTSECAICFSKHCDSQDSGLPAKLCNNEKCNVLYHVHCLSQWLLSMPMNVPCFGMVSGKCPNCKQDLKCEIPE